MRVTLEQRRARHAWEKAGRYKSEHVAFAKGLPALIMNSGLMQVMAFCNEKGGKTSQGHVKEVADDMLDWLHQQCGTPAQFEAFMEEMMQTTDSRCYQQVTIEALAWLKWLRQMASARVGGE